MPTGPDDVVLGQTTMRDLGLDLGREVPITDKQGAHHSMTVVGEVVLPATDSNGKVGSGAAVTSATFDKFVGDRIESGLAADLSARRPTSRPSSAGWGSWDWTSRCTPDRKHQG